MSWTFFKRNKDERWTVGITETETDIAIDISNREDARLISAAPELLKACKYVLGVINRPGGPISTDLEMMTKALTKAVTKAEGK